MTKAIPEGYHSVSPMLVVKDARKAIEFYKRAFGAQELYQYARRDEVIKPAFRHAGFITFTSFSGTTDA